MGWEVAALMGGQALLGGLGNVTGGHEQQLATFENESYGGKSLDPRDLLGLALSSAGRLGQSFAEHAQNPVFLNGAVVQTPYVPTFTGAPPAPPPTAGPSCPDGYVMINGRCWLDTPARPDPSEQGPPPVLRPPPVVLRRPAPSPPDPNTPGGGSPNCLLTGDCPTTPAFSFSGIQGASPVPGQPPGPSVPNIPDFPTGPFENDPADPTTFTPGAGGRFVTPPPSSMFPAAFSMPTFAGGGLPMPIGVLNQPQMGIGLTGQDPGLFDSSMWSLPGVGLYDPFASIGSTAPGGWPITRDKNDPARRPVGTSSGTTSRPTGVAPPPTFGNPGGGGGGGGTGGSGGGGGGGTGGSGGGGGGGGTPAPWTCQEPGYKTGTAADGTPICVPDIPEDTANVPGQGGNDCFAGDCPPPAEFAGFSSSRRNPASMNFSAGGGVEEAMAAFELLGLPVPRRRM